MTESLADPLAESLAAIFDLDGLLVDSEPLWAESARRLLGRRGIAADPSLRPRLMGHPALEVARAFVTHYELSDPPEALVVERLAIMKVLVDRGVAAQPGAEALIVALSREGVPMAVASSSPPLACSGRTLRLPSATRSAHCAMVRPPRKRRLPGVMGEHAALVHSQSCASPHPEDASGG